MRARPNGHVDVQHALGALTRGVPQSRTPSAPRAGDTIACPDHSARAVALAGCPGADTEHCDVAPDAATARSHDLSHDGGHKELNLVGDAASLWRACRC